jgi:cytochrome c oxidase assembly protein subunit 15
MPSFDSIFVEVNFAHRCGALIVTVFVIWTVARVIRFHSRESQLRRPTLGVLALLIAQVTLGALTIWSGRAVLPTTAHVAVGAAVLATSLELTIRAHVLGGLASAAEAARVPAPFSGAIERKITA